MSLIILFMFTWLRLSSCQSWKLLEDHPAQAVLDPKRGNLALLHTCSRNCELGWNTQLDLELNWWQEQGNDIHWAIRKHVHHQTLGLVLDAEWQRLCPWLPGHRNSCDSGFKPKQEVQVLCQACVFRSHQECQDHCESWSCSHHVPVLPSSYLQPWGNCRGHAAWRVGVWLRGRAAVGRLDSKNSRTDLD